MKVILLLDESAPAHTVAVWSEVASHLEHAGIPTKPYWLNEAPVRLDGLRIEADVYVQVANTELAMSLATGLELLGARVLNRSHAALAVRNRALAAASLLRAGIAVPPAWVAAHPAQLRPFGVAGPLLVQPALGPASDRTRHEDDSGHVPRRHLAAPALGPARVSASAVERSVALKSAGDDAPYGGLVLAQRAAAPGRALTVYAAGGELFGVRGARVPWTARADALHPELCALSPEQQDLARRCGEVFGLELYAVRLARAEPGALAVRDVDAFPHFMGVPQVARRLAGYVASIARHTSCGD